MLQHYWNHTISLFRVISRTLVVVVVVGVLFLCRDAVGVLFSPHPSWLSTYEQDMTSIFSRELNRSDLIFSLLLSLLPCIQNLVLPFYLVKEAIVEMLTRGIHSVKCKHQHPGVNNLEVILILLGWLL